MQIEQNHKRRVAYFYNAEISRYSYPTDHPMKPQRIAMAHSLIVQYGLYPKLDVYMTRKAAPVELQKFHMQPYVDYLSNYVSSSIVNNYELLGLSSLVGLRSSQERRNNIGELRLKQTFKVGDSFDCPAFNGLYDFCQLSAGGSIDSARTIIYGGADVAVNWGGGLHHAKKCEASGFCYVNDIVLCILELLEVYPRVLYLDIDVHHGDGVEEAFYLTNRVMTVSFHQYGDDFFPGTGNIGSVGQGQGQYYSLNIPLKKGISDTRYFELFKTVMGGVMSRYRPDAVVLQLGADSLCHDKLGNFNLSIKCHGACADYMMKFGVPLIMVGGGGYTIENVARCWAYETGVALGEQLEDPIPKTDPFYKRYNHEKKLHIEPMSVADLNTVEEMQALRKQVFEHLRELQIAPGTQLHDVSWRNCVILDDEGTVEELQKEDPEPQ